MRKLILTLAILAQIATVAAAQAAQPAAPPTPPSLTKDGQDTAVEADKKRIQDHWDSLPGTTSKKATKTKTKTPDNQSSPADTKTP